ncbi:MAG: hypothetical protein NBV63_02425 [Candidatus Pacebacteria bacterium]|nr:hypothetical protein [Candidatus Paceibacterota bacterium]
MKVSPLAKVQILRQGGLFVAYSHALDIATTGKSETDARAKFQTVVDLCTKGGVPKSGICNKLMSLGWTQKSKRWSPPEPKARVKRVE